MLRKLESPSLIAGWMHWLLVLGCYLIGALVLWH